MAASGISWASVLVAGGVAAGVAALLATDAWVGKKLADEYEKNPLPVDTGDENAVSDYLHQISADGQMQVEDHAVKQALEKVAHSMEDAMLRQKNEIYLTLVVDEFGRVTSSSNDPNTTARIDLKRGHFFGDPTGMR